MKERTENIMGTKPIGSLLLGMAFPIMISLIVQALYNVVDSVFVSMLSENALTSVSLVYPIQKLMIAVAVGTSVGMNSLLSCTLGEKQYEKANRVANNGVFLSIAGWAVFVIIGLTCSTWFLNSFTTNPEIATAGADYMRICTVFSFGMFVQITMDRVLQVTGKAIYQMLSQLVGAVVNIFLDPILIFGLFGLPKMGVKGAAWATVISQIVGMVIILIINHYKNHEVRINFKEMMPDVKTICGIYQVGLPATIMLSIGSVMVFGMNKILIAFTDTAVSVFGVYFKLESFVFMPVYGVTNALVPIIAYNYGARRKDRIMQTLKLSNIVISVILIAGTALFLLAPTWLLSLFNASESMYAIGVPALRIISLSFCITGVAFVLSCLFQALGEGVLSLLMSIFRQLVLLLPCAWLLAHFFGLEALWYSFLISEGCALILAIFFYKRVYERKLKNMEP
ncbi:MAG: MATE family efflux transporter [Ruthenibacterium sp.]